MTPAEFARRIAKKKSRKQAFLYFPFANYKKDEVLAEDVGDLKKAGVEFKLIKKSWRCLTRVGDDAILMIAGHGDEGSGQISMEGPKGEKSLGATDLADQLASYGLSKKHQSILLLTCFGGGGLKNKPQGAPRVVGSGPLDLRSNAAGQCLASILAKALGKRGYLSILVGGWPGSFVSNDWEVSGPSFLSDEDDAYSAQLDHIQWYDAYGNNTAG